MLPVLIVIACALSRLIPHPPNLTPVGATAVFAGRSLPPLAAIALSWSAMGLADLGLARLQGVAHAWNLATPFVYAGFALQAWLGHVLRTRSFGALTAAAAGALGFFVLSNFGVWLGPRYAHDLPGLGACYLAALPFFGRSLAGDLCWTALLALGYRAL